MSMFLNRVKKNFTHLKKWAKRENLTAFRVYDRDIPEFPYAVDYYDGALVVYEFVRRHSRSGGDEFEAAAEQDDLEGDELGGDTRASLSEEAEAEARTMAVLGDLVSYFNIPASEIFLKQRRRKSGLAQYEKLAAASNSKVVSEYGLKFLVNLSDYLDTGLFLDHRLTRLMLGNLAKDKRVLNLFCYTASASVHAAAGGAHSVTSVDMSNTYLAWGQDNFALNGLLDGTQGLAKHRFVREDVAKFLRQERMQGEKYDLIFVDPPSFSNSKKMDGFFDVQLHHVDLLQGCLDVLSNHPDALIVFSNNLRSFKFDLAAFPDCKVENITERTLPPDYRNRKIHNVWTVRPLK